MAEKRRNIHRRVSQRKGIPSQTRSSPPRPRPARIARVPVFHEGTFRALLLSALEGLACFRHRGRFWQPLEVGRGFGLYQQAPDPLSVLQQRVEEYEVFFYSRLLDSHCGPDGIFRPRTHLARTADGALRPSHESEGEMP